jgi:hypothetical protein
MRVAHAEESKSICTSVFWTFGHVKPAKVNHTAKRKAKGGGNSESFVGEHLKWLGKGHEQWRDEEIGPLIQPAADVLWQIKKELDSSSLFLETKFLSIQPKTYWPF